MNSTNDKGKPMNKPATPLPWEKYAGDYSEIEGQRMAVVVGKTCISDALDAVHQSDAAYIVHAANAYPQLVAALRELMLRCDGDEGVRADGSNIQTMQASAVLHNLGEI